MSGKSGAFSHYLGEEEHYILEEGASISQLARIFQKDKRNVASAVKGLKPVGERMGFPIYKLSEAAGRLAIPDEARIIESIQRLKPHQLPVKLQKEFWDAARSRQRYLEDQKDLWRTNVILEALLQTFKTFRTSCHLLVDHVERQTELSERQREIIIGLSDDLLSEVQRSLITNSVFSEYSNSVSNDDEIADLNNFIASIGPTDNYDEYDDGLGE